MPDPSISSVVRTVRVGANSMDKIDLPLPESVGIDTYDDSCLVFRRTRGRHEGTALFELEITDAGPARSTGDRLSLVRPADARRPGAAWCSTDPSVRCCLPAPLRRYALSAG